MHFKKNLYLPILFCILIFSVTYSDSAIAKNRPTAVFSQELLAYDTNGNPYPALEINPSEIPGMKRYRFNIDEESQLIIASNAKAPFSRGLEKLAETIKRSVRFIEEQSGKDLNSNILLYLVEMSYVPQYYKFAASYSENDTQWDQVRVAFIKPETPLYDPNSLNNLNELIFDTLPHELGHDLLSKTPNLLHDRDGQPSKHTRWFIEGVCELIAKNFSSLEAPAIAPELLKRRNPLNALHNSRIRDELFSWEQENSLPIKIESDLYGAAYLMMQQWTSEIQLASILKQIESGRIPIAGKELKDLLLQTTNLTPIDLYEEAKYSQILTKTTFYNN